MDVIEMKRSLLRAVNWENKMYPVTALTLPAPQTNAGKHILVFLRRSTRNEEHMT